MKTITLFCAGVVATAALLVAAAGEPSQVMVAKTNAAKMDAATIKVTPALAASRELWRKSLVQIPLPKKGCFRATYPNKTWQETGCVQAPNKPQPPQRGAKPFTVGNGTDWSAQVTSGHIASATGTFATISGMTSESGAGGSPNTYSLQLNSDFFPSTACAPSPNPNCRGWEQFVYSNAGFAFIQYWLIQYNTACPGGWNTYTIGSDTYCWRNANNSAAVPVQPLSNFGALSITGTVSGGGDSISFSTGGSVYTAAGDNSVNAAAGWTAAEYNVVGDCCGSQANFNAGTTMVVRTSVDNGTLAAPSCVLEGFTGETNNLTLSGGPAVIPVLHEPRIEFTQSNPAGTPQNCAASIGDTHLATFDGLFYDFQASGDFILAQNNSGFTVQTRQASGAPTWPNAAVNKAVGTQIGSTRVAICAAPNRVFVNGVAKDVGDGQALALGGGVSLYRGGDSYVVWRNTGESMRALIHTIPGNSWIDVAVGMPKNAVRHGLIANPGGNIAALAMRNGTVLNEPVSFNDLYHGYADSWRVKNTETLLAPCSGQNVVAGIPLKAFYAKDLAPDQQQKARALCAAGGVDDATALDACTLDAAVLGHAAVTKAFAKPLGVRAVLRPDIRLERLKIVEPVTVPNQGIKPIEQKQP
ncbi:MAG: hypothetical protein P4L57_04000 [Rhizomicrobium sp.]|nr:hypothetical protein [Rhizomicrobium sp.]